MGEPPRPDEELAEARPLPPGQRLSERLQLSHYGRVPRIDLASWSLTISGETEDGGITRLAWPDIVALPHEEVRADHHCVAGWSSQDLRWGGVPCRALVDSVPPSRGAAYALASAVYGYHSSITVADLLSPRALLATHLNGKPLAPEHGWPMRLILPHLFGWKGPKWLLAIEYSSRPMRGFWEQRGYHLTGDAWRGERYAYQE